MPKEQASQHFSTLRFDRSCKVASDGEMPGWHPVIRIVLSEAGILSNVRRSDHTLAPEGRPEDLGIARLRKLGECFARGARQRVERIGFSSFIEHIVEERSECGSR